MRGQFKGYTVHAFSKEGVLVREFGFEAKLDEWQPDDPALFAVDLQFYAGPVGGNGADAFELTVCSPGWLLRANDQCTIFSPGHTLLMRHYGATALLRFLDEHCRTVSGETWTEIALQLDRLGAWEFHYRMR